MLVSLPNYTQNTTLSTTANVSTVSLSSVPGFISVNDLSVPGYGIIEQKDTSFIAEAYPDVSEKGPPRFFAMRDNVTLLIGPTPNAVYTLNLEYFGKWPSLVTLGLSSGTQTQETFISANFETALLSACMKYASMYMRDAESAKMFDDEMMANLGLVDKFARGKAKKPISEDSQAANDAGDNK